jgi:predicted TIM-barrel fold metal-dependent hydrolase
MIIDCHTHWSHVVADPYDPAKFISVLKKNGIGHAAVFPVAGLCDDTQMRRDHDEIAAVCGKSDGIMIPFCTAPLWNRDEALSEVHRCLEMHFGGIKIHPWLQGASVQCETMDLLCELAEEFGVPVFFHDGTPPFSLPSQIGLLARRHPEVKIVLGHCGLFDMWREAITVLNTEPNVYGCVCGPYPAAIKEILNHCPVAKLVWGSDFGFGPTDLYGYRLGMMNNIGIEDGTPARILGENAVKLLDLS